MIVPMKKVTVLIQERDALSALGELRFLGLMHVEHIQPPQGKEISILAEDIAFINEAVNILSMFQPKKPPQLPEKERLPPDWKFVVKHIIDAHKRIEQLKEYRQTLTNRISAWEIWGEFNPKSIKSLAAEAVMVGLYQIPLHEIKSLGRELFVKVISVKAGIAHCAVVSRTKPDLPFKELEPPEMSLTAMRQRLEDDLRAIETIKKDLSRYADLMPSLFKKKQELQKEMEFYQALKGMGRSESIAYLTGYVPYDCVSAFKKTAHEQHWAFLIQEPSENDAVPTLIRNNRLVSLINPVFKLLEIIPGYRELDVSPLFLFFLSLFFGMIIGDAGYGSVYFLLTFLLQRKLARRSPDQRIFYLLYLFSACAIFWGLLTGTVFGQEWFLKVGRQALLPVLNDTTFLQAFCFFLGAFHLTLAHAWQALRKFPSLVALSDVGWICILWAANFLARTLILDLAFPAWARWLIITGLVLVIFFSNPQKNILKTIGSGLGKVALSLMNNFTDVVSYIRLFAIGLAGVAIADTVNALAAGLPKEAFLGKVLIVFVGHTINIMLGPISVLVHGIRLNVLEFSSHAELSWSGTTYKPLKA
jgi:V/A-type H+-transporting ATPase subunit I